MNKHEIINYWKNSAESDFKTMQNLYNSKDYCWCLFVGHLVIEKLLKAAYVKNNDENVPRTHDLLRLAEKSGVPLDDEKKDTLDIITTFNISARYPDYKQSFYKKCTEKFAGENIDKIKELKSWLTELI